MKSWIMGFSAFVLSGFGLVSAQETGRMGNTYTPDYFERFAPRTAFDMVRQLPGISIDDREDNGARGFGQASGNVLINGQRISGKSNSARDALGRIQAENVTRIEVVDASTLDIPGLSGQVVNVIADASEGISGTWRWGARFRENLRPYYDNVELAVSGGSGALAWSLEAKSEPRRGGAAGLERVFDAAGNLTERRKEDFTFIATRPSVAGSASWTPANGHIANINGNAALWQPNIKEVSKRKPLSGPESRRLFQRAEDEWNFEIGGDYALGLGPGRAKIIGLVRRENSDFINRVTSAALDGSFRDVSVFDQLIDEGEYIVRGEYDFSFAEGRDWQIAVEGAFNYLDSEAALAISTGDGPLIDEPLTNASSRVEEQRAEASITYSRPLTPSINFQTSLGVEVSELSQSGAAGQTRTLTRPKGYVQAAWTPNSKTSMTARVSREVGQLNFFDFISSVNLNQENTREGNPEIVPQQSWRAELITERDFGVWGAGALTLYGEDIEDIVDRIPIGTGDGPGNIDTAQRFGAEIDVTLKLDPVGIAGGQVELSSNLVTSTVDDPVTLRSRRINNDNVSFVSIEYRHDVNESDWAYGFGASSEREAATFNLAQRYHETKNPGDAFVFVEHKDLSGMTGTIRLENLVNQRDKAAREFYDTNRLGPLIGSEVRDRKFGPRFILGLEGSF